jgi:hypothetical protein
MINVAFHFQTNWVKQKLDGELTEEMQQEGSYDHAEGALS